MFFRADISVSQAKTAEYILKPPEKMENGIIPEEQKRLLRLLTEHNCVGRITLKVRRSEMTQGIVCAVERHACCIHHLFLYFRIKDFSGHYP
jgi:hypothetical protein